MNTENKCGALKTWELVNFCEFDKYAVKSYCAIHNESEDKNLGDITKVDETKLNPFNMIVGGSPCQDFSVAGKQRGSVWICNDCTDENGEPFEYNPLTVHWSKRDCCPHCGSKNLDKSRSSLLVEWLRVIRGNKPNFGIYENVKNIVGKQFKETFKMFTDELVEYGYNVYWKVLNAKEYGIPQNRQRVYLILIKKELDNGKFKYPEQFDNGTRLKDILEHEVDEKFYISNSRLNILLKNIDINKVSDNSLIGSSQKHASIKNDGISTSLTSAMGMGGGQTPMIFEQNGIDKSYNSPKLIKTANCITAREDGEINNHKSEGTAVLESRVLCIGNTNPSGHGMNNNVFDSNGLAPTLTTNKGERQKVLIPQATKQGYIECNIPGVADLSFPDSKTRRGRVQNSGEICPTLMASQQDICYIKPNVLEPKLEFGRIGRQAVETYNENQPKYGSTINPFNKTVDNSEKSPTLTTRLEGFKTAILPVTSDLRIRKLTPKECFRLMGFSDKDFHAAEKMVSNSQLYKQAGNSIVIDVLYYILVELYKAMPYLFNDLKLGSYFSGIGAFEAALERLFESINSGNFTQPQVV